MGRLTRDPEVRYSAGENALAIARYTLAVDRRFRRDGEATADFISCVVFGRGAEFAEKYFHQGIRIVVSGRIQTGSSSSIPSGIFINPSADAETGFGIDGANGALCYEKKRRTQKKKSLCILR